MNFDGFSITIIMFKKSLHACIQTFRRPCGTVFIAMFSGCGDSASTSNGATSESGTLSLRLADAPLTDEQNVTGVYITITGIAHETQDGGWQEFEAFNASAINPINLLDWQEGRSIHLGDFRVPAGHYSQIRFMLDAVEESKVAAGNPGCVIEVDDVNHTLFVPSGSQTGYKGIGNFDVPVNDDVNITSDFDVRKSVTCTGNGLYKLKPTIKLVLPNEAGRISGTLGGLDANSTYVIYAYGYDEDGTTTWDINETVDANTTDTIDPRFSHAISSAAVKTNGSYTLPFLAPGDYDLAAARYAVDGIYTLKLRQRAKRRNHPARLELLISRRLGGTPSFFCPAIQKPCRIKCFGYRLTGEQTT